MTSGWTGGQYSIYRGLLAISVACVLRERLLVPTASGPDGVLMLVGLLGCVALALGWHDRVASLCIWFFALNRIAFMDGAPVVLPGADVVVSSVLLLLHAGTPKDPFGAWTARGRPDPSGDWRMPGWVVHVAWALLAIVYLVTDLERVSGSAFRSSEINGNKLAAVGLAFDLAFLLAVFRSRWRASAWIAMSLWKLAGFFAFGPTVGGSNLWLLHLLASDPAWLPGRSGSMPGSIDTSLRARPDRLFYDGECGLCHHSVRFILAEEGNTPKPLRLRFAPIGSDAFSQMISTNTSLHPSDLPDSIVLELGDGRILTRSSAVLEIANRMGGFWRVMAQAAELGGLLPHSVLDIAYDGLARIRKRLFARPKESCPILPPALRTRFDS
jgi:predicted DCC family thiol-disulfide oxidoreductase YuxK